MSQILVERAADRRPRHRPGPAHHLAFLGRLAGLVAAAWAVSLGACDLGVGWLLPPLLLIGTASLLGGGRTLLDRVMLALMLLLGAGCAGGLLFSVWPWGLDPAVIGGTGLSVLIVLGALLRRRPSLPRPALVDVLPLVAGGGGALYLARQYLRGDFGHRIGLAMAGEDLGRHFSIFDGIRAMGGYLFVHPSEAGQHVYEGIIRYPQGFHLTAALLDGFLRSSPAQAGSASAFDHFLGFHNAAYGLLMLTVVWAAMWIGGPLLRAGARPALVFAFLVPFMLYTDLVSDYVSGYPSEILGLTLVAMLVAVLARPLPGIHTQLLIVSALLVAIGFSYYLYLPGAALGTWLWLILRRRRLRGHVLFVAVLAVPTGALALTAPVLGTLVGDAASALAASASVRTSRAVLLALALALLAGMVSRSGRRLWVWRRYRLCAGSALAFSAVLGGYQQGTDGVTGYYFEKSLHAVEVCLLVGVGALATLVPAPVRPRTGLALRQRLSGGLPALLLAAAVVAALGVVPSDSPFRPGVTGGGVNWGRTWAAGRIAAFDAGRTVATIYTDHPPRPGELTLVFAAGGLRQYDLTLFVSVLQRGVRPGIYRALYGGPDNLVDTDPAALETVLLDIGQPIEAVTTTTTTTEFIREMKAKHPALPLRLVDLSGLS
jgi:hypothetical protein